MKKFKNKKWKKENNGNKKNMKNMKKIISHTKVDKKTVKKWEVQAKMSNMKIITLMTNKVKKKNMMNKQSQVNGLIYLGMEEPILLKFRSHFDMFNLIYHLNIYSN